MRLEIEFPPYERSLLRRFMRHLGIIRDNKPLPHDGIQFFWLWVYLGAAHEAIIRRLKMPKESR